MTTVFKKSIIRLIDAFNRFWLKYLLVDQNGSTFSTSRECPAGTAYSFAHAKIKNSIFNRKILELGGDFDIIMNDFQSCLSY